MIIEKIIDGSATKQELLSWKDSVGNNLWHIFSSEDNENKSSYYFLKICNKVQPEDLKEKLLEKNSLGDTPLHIIAWSNSVALLNYVLEQQNIDLNQAIDIQGRNIAFIATEMSHSKILDLCFSHNLDLTHQDKNNRTLENYAISYDNQHCLEKIQKIKGISEYSSNQSTDGNNEVLSFFKENKHNLRGQKNL